MEYETPLSKERIPYSYYQKQGVNTCYGTLSALMNTAYLLEERKADILITAATIGAPLQLRQVRASQKFEMIHTTD